MARITGPRRGTRHTAYTKLGPRRGLGISFKSNYFLQRTIATTTILCNITEMTLLNLPYPHLVSVDHTASAADVMLQQYHLIQEENVFHKLANDKSHPKIIIIAIQALDNILHIALNHCDDVSIEQVEPVIETFDWRHPNFETIEQDVLPIVLIKLLMGISKIHVVPKLIINWQGFINKYAQAMPNK